MTEITKEAIEAAKAAYWHEAYNGGGYSDKCYEAALTAALPFLSTLPNAGEGKAELYTKLVAFLGKVQGVSMGVAMSGKDHPNPDGALMDLFNDAQELYQEHLAALISSPGKDGGQEVEAVAGAIKGIGFDHNGGGFASIQIGDREYTGDEVRRALASPSPQSTVDADAVIERLTKALRSADEWMSCVEAHLQSGEPFKRDRDAMRSALSALAKSPSSDRAASEGWQPIETAPKDGKRCLLAVKEGAFIYAVQGAYQAGEWNAVHRNNVKPLCWMPNVRVPAEFLPYRDTPEIAEAKGSGQ